MTVKELIEKLQGLPEDCKDLPVGTNEKPFSDLNVVIVTWPCSCPIFNEDRHQSVIIG